MTIPELTEEQRIESFIGERLNEFDDEVKFTKKELAEFCLKEIDYAVSLVNSTDVKDVEEACSED